MESTAIESIAYASSKLYFGAALRTYFVHGPFYFTSANRFLKILNADTDPEQVEVVFSEATSLFDYSAMQAMNKISSEYKSKGKQITFKSLCPKSTKLLMKAQHLMSETEYTERDMEVADLKGVEYGLGDLPEGGELGHVLERYGVPERRQDSSVVNHQDLTVVVGNDSEVLKGPTRSVSRVKKSPGCIMVCPCTGGV